MAYATSSDVAERLPGRVGLSENSKPSTTQIDTWIGRIEARWNARLKWGGYTVPITGDESLKIMKDFICERLVAMVELAIALGNNAPSGSIFAMIRDIDKQVFDIAKEGRQGYQYLYDAEYAQPTDGPEASTFFTDNTSEDPGQRIDVDADDMFNDESEDV